MFDESNNREFDDMMRSILTEAREEAPAHVWEGISARLDNIEATRSPKPVMLWFRRGAVAVAAAAAVIMGLMIDWNGAEQTIVPERQAGSDMIAVVELPVEVMDEGETTAVETYVADAQSEISKARNILDEMIAAHESDGQVETVANRQVETAANRQVETAAKEPEVVQDARQEAPVTFPDEWEEEEKPAARATSLVFSAVTGTNTDRNGNSGGLLRRPTISTAPAKTGIKQTSNESAYGLPLSFGAGVRIGLGPKWSIGTGLNYTFLTRKFFGTYTLVGKDGNIETSTSSDIRNSQHYIGIPLNAYYEIISRDHINFYAYAGGAAELCLSDKYDVLNTSIIHKEKAKGIQLSANLGIGVEFLLGKHLGLYIDPSLRYYFDCGQPASIRTEQPLMLGLEMGLRVNL